MLARLAAFLDRNRIRVLAAAVVGAAVAGALGFGAAGRLSPYGQNDPATQSVQSSQPESIACVTARENIFGAVPRGIRLPYCRA